MKNFAKYLLVMIIPLAVLLSRPVIPLLTLAFGQEVKLATVPFDPRDFFRGDYVELSFEIENVSAGLISPSLLAKLNEEDDNDDYRPDGEMDVYVSLKPDESGIYNAALVSDVSGAPGGGVYVRGKLEKYSYPNRSGTGIIRIDYGNNLSRFYVKENTGPELEDAARKGKIRAAAKVWNGNIALDKIEIKE